MRYATPGVYLEEVFVVPPAELRTGVPAFLGLAARGTPGEPVRLTRWDEFVAAFGPAGAALHTAPPGAAPVWPAGWLAHAVHGFFANGGTVCWVVRLEDPGDEEMRAALRAAVPGGADLEVAALERGLAALDALDEVDLVCAPDVARGVARLRPPGSQASGGEELPEAAAAAERQQAAVLAHCTRLGTRFALLDAFPGAPPDEAGAHARRLRSTDGALYYPWIDVGPQPWLPPAAGSPEAYGRMGPPCGHVAGIVARSDARTGVHKAPANEVVEGALDLEVRVTDGVHGTLPRTLNVVRAFPGRGIRVWGARTLGGEEEPAWAYVPVRRLFLTVGRWMERALAQVAFEPQGQTLWTRVEREVGSYLAKLHARGALRGATPMEAFYVRCDASTNPPELRDAGQVVTEVGLAPGTPSEFVVVRITHGAGGVTITGPSRPG